MLAAYCLFALLPKRLISLYRKWSAKEGEASAAGAGKKAH